MPSYGSRDVSAAGLPLVSPSGGLLRPVEAREALISAVERSGIERVDVVAWRDLDDAESGGSELHAHEVLTRWAAAGINVHLFTSRVDGAARQVSRHGYVAHRAAGRYAVFPRTALLGLTGHIGAGQA